MNESLKKCQNCKNEFQIKQEDFKFYEKIKVPPPTWCPQCRQTRRYIWRNERSLVKTNCDRCNKSVFSCYKNDAPFPIFCRECWWGDSWNPEDYAMEYDFSRSFFDQWRELFYKVPQQSLFNSNSTNSDFANVVIDSKNIFLSYSIVEAEEVFYSKNVDRSRQVLDCLCINDCENSAYLIYGRNNYAVFYSQYVSSCVNSYFLFDCANCSDCFMSSNLRNKKYVFRNQQYSREDYMKLLEAERLDSYENIQKLSKEFENLNKASIHKYGDILKAIDSSGHAISDVRNAKNIFEAYDMENVKYAARTFSVKDSYDFNNTGLGSELLYEYINGGTTMSRIFFGVSHIGSNQDLYYSGWCGNSNNLFGCIGLRNKSYCILNKQYSKEEYEVLVEKIKQQMKAIPFIGKNGREYYYGEFFPVELSPFSYDKSDVQEILPLSKQEIQERGYNYFEKEEYNYEPTIYSRDLADSIKEVDENILKEIIACAHGRECIHQCTFAFRINPEEINFYKKHNMPLPRMCPNCRHFKRLEFRNPWKLWTRTCMKDGCNNEFETSYSPDREERVYCESCYNQEVY